MFLMLTLVLKLVEILLSLGVPDLVGECFGLIDRVYQALEPPPLPIGRRRSGGRRRPPRFSPGART